MVIFLYTIKNNIENSLKIKNSNFITCLFYVENISDALQYIKEVKNKYPKASHYCYAYIIGPVNKACDDGEPSGTAGIPMLNVLIQKNLKNILAVVVRYFGGIKLGAAGLLRAYTTSVTSALELSGITEIIPGIRVKVTINYSGISNFEYLIKDSTIISKVFSDNACYIVDIDAKNLNIISNYNYEIISHLNIKKKP